MCYAIFAILIHLPLYCIYFFIAYKCYRKYLKCSESVASVLVLVTQLGITVLCWGCPLTHIENIVHRKMYGTDLHPYYDFWDSYAGQLFEWILNLF